MPKRVLSETDLASALPVAIPELGEIVAAAGGAPVFLVGGAVRDLLLKRGRDDLDLVVEGDPAELAERLGAEVVSHERFATAKARLGEHEMDIARARQETYAHPGALPEVTPADIAEDLARRDFTINAMAIPLGIVGAPRLLDPHGGRADLEAGLLRVLHPGSFADDPIRALRAARYAARFGLELEGDTAERLAATDLGAVSAERREAELLRIAAEPTAPQAFSLLERWGLVELRPGGAGLATRVLELLGREPWAGTEQPERAVLAAALGPQGGEEALAAVHPERPSAGVEAVKGHDSTELLLARALGADWLDELVGRWRGVKLEISGDDLLAAGVPAGPAVGRGLREALARKLDGEVEGREEELAAALRAASD
jgi:tRNA nucleotidyltransferase (CCA-adding enzyme)